MLKNLPLKRWFGLFIFTMIFAILVFWEIFLELTENPFSSTATEKIHGQNPEILTTQIAVSQVNPSTNSPTPQASPDEDKVASILGDQNLTPRDAVKHLIKELPRFEVATQQEAAQHIANLSDDQTASIWMQKLISNQFPLPAAEILFNNLLTRSEDLVLPTLAAIADQQTHPKQAESSQILESLLGSPDTGCTWKAWLNKKLSAER